jgi:hypothetical protein
MMFMELDHGAILRKETGLDTPKIVRFIGNPLIMKEMAKYVLRRRARGRALAYNRALTRAPDYRVRDHDGYQ